MFDKRKLKAEMAKKCMSASYLSAVSGVGHDTLSKILNTDRQPNTETIGRLAKALEIEPEKLLKED